MRLASGFFVLASGSCHSTTSALETRFSRSYSCPEADVQVVDRGGLVYEASGCGRRVEYVCGTFASTSDPGKGCQERGLPRRATADEDAPALPRAHDPERMPGRTR